MKEKCREIRKGIKISVKRQRKARNRKGELEIVKMGDR